MPIRVYELSKNLGISNKELLQLLNENGYTVATHMAQISDEAAEFVSALLKKKTTPAVKEEKANEPKHDNLEAKKNVLEVKPQQSKKEEKKTENNEITLSGMSPDKIAQIAKKQVSDVILTLLKKGIIANKNQLLDEQTVKDLAQIYNLKIVSKKEKEKEDEELKKEAQSSQKVKHGNFEERLPIVVVLGHVDHGKTSLLDFIRKSRVAAREKGGITQHLGAYEAQTKHGKVVFLDTPGHEAFSMLRARGIKAADIGVLVVAADDGVMPQTVEAINQAKSIGLPIIVAINKIDKVDQRQIDVVKQQLSKHDLIAEDWGGKTVIVPISAKTGAGIDDLLEVLVLQAQLLELKANTSIAARGFILESNVEKGLGPIATVILQHGKLNVGDYFISGKTSGKVNSIVDSYSKRLKEVGPSVPVKISGFDELPQPGDLFEAVSGQEYKKFNSKQKSQEMESLLIRKKGSIKKESTMNLLIKTDNVSSKEALIGSIEKLGTKIKYEFNIVFAGVGDINESDIILASDTNSIIYGLHVKTQSNAQVVLSRFNVIIKNFDIIYKLLEDLEITAEASKPIKLELKKIGEAFVIQIFDIKKIGIIAGAKVKSGQLIRGAKARILRNNSKVGEGTIKELQREKRAVKEVNINFECAVFIPEFQDWQLDDIIECYQEVPSIKK